MSKLPNPPRESYWVNLPLFIRGVVRTRSSLRVLSFLREEYPTEYPRGWRCRIVQRGKNHCSTSQSDQSRLDPWDEDDVSLDTQNQLANHHRNLYRHFIGHCSVVSTFLSDLETFFFLTSPSINSCCFLIALSNIFFCRSDNGSY